MTLPTGTIGMDQVNVELLKAATALITLNDANVRTLAGIASGTISLNDLRGKTRALTQAEVVDFAYNNYLNLFSLTNKTGTVFDARTDRNGLAGGEESQSLGTFNTSIAAPTGSVNGCTIIYFGARQSGSSATISSPTVNGAAVSVTQYYNAQGNTNVSAGYVGMAYGYVNLQPQAITTAAANFPVGGGSNILNAGAIYIVPGRWSPAGLTSGGSSAAVSVSINANELVTYSCYNSSDSSAQNITQSAGTLIASCKQNWYDGCQHGLVYRTTAGSVTMTPTSTATGCFIKAVRWTYG
jgi:hypothetical protein